MGRDEAALLRRLVKPWMHPVDVGANTGLYSLLRARLVERSGSALAFEPEPNLFATLRETNNATNVFPFQCALGRANGLATFHRSAFNSGDNRLGRASIGHDGLK
jgi:FkbM family methyltransferase